MKESLATSEHGERAIEQARLTVHQPSLLPSYACFAAVLVALVPQVALQHTTWFHSKTAASRPEVIAAFAHLNGTVNRLPGDISLSLWAGSVVIASAGLVLGLASRPFVRAIGTIVAVVAIALPGFLSARSGLSLSRFAMLGTAASVLALLAAGLCGSRVSPSSFVRPAGRVVCGVVSVACLVAQFSASKEVHLGSDSPEAAALEMVEAVNQRDLLQVMLHITPEERPLAGGVSSLSESQRKALDLVISALELSGEPGGVVVKSVERTSGPSDGLHLGDGQVAASALVRVVPGITGAGSAALNLLGGLPIAVQEIDNRWYVSTEASLKAAKQ